MEEKPTGFVQAALATMPTMAGRAMNQIAIIMKNECEAAINEGNRMRVFSDCGRRSL
jgi:hypothetical protein